MKSGECQQFHLLVETVPSNDGTGCPSGAPQCATLPVPNEPALLIAAADGALHFVPVANPPAGSALRIEPITRRARLLAMNSDGGRLRVNGQLATLVAVLKEKDFVQFSGGYAAHVTVLHRPHIGAPTPELLGRECPVCRLKFEAASKCWRCACGVAFHCEDSGGLECVQTRTECTCGRPITLKEGFTWLPDFHHEQKIPDP